MDTRLTSYSVRDFMSYLYNLGMCKSLIHVSDVESMYTLAGVRVDSVLWENTCLTIVKYNAMLTSRRSDTVVTVNVLPLSRLYGKRPNCSCSWGSRYRKLP